MGQRLLEKDSYLEGLDVLLKKYAIQEVYTYDKFIGVKEDGLTFFVYGITFETANLLTAYVDNYMDDDTEALPEQRSSFSPTRNRIPDGAGCIYREGNFYTWKE